MISLLDYLLTDMNLVCRFSNQQFWNTTPYVKPGAADHWVHQLPGGIFQNLAPHPAYLLLAFLGEPTNIQAVAQKTGRVPTAFADELRVLVSAEDGLGCFMVSLSIQPFMKYVHIFGTEATHLRQPHDQ